MKHLKPLTSLRFFAAFVVVLCHVRYAHEAQLPRGVWNFAKNGFVGVNLFFVLSGFVIAYNYGERFLLGTTSFRQFIVARFARVWPAFMTALLLAVPVYIFRSPEAMRKLPWMIPVHLLLIHNWFPNLGASWLAQSWTIGTEWGFYLLFPLFAAAVFRLRERGLWALLLISAALSFVAPALYQSGSLAGDDLALVGAAGLTAAAFWGRVLRWYSIVRLPEFLVGVCVCRLYMLQNLEARERWIPRIKWAAALSLALVLVVMVVDPFPLMFTNQAVLTLPFAAILWFLAYDRGTLARWMAAPILVLLGEASYSLYLIHPIVKQVVLIGGRHLLHLEPSSYFLTACTIVFSILASIAIFKGIERPARRAIVARFAPLPTRPVVEQEPAPSEPTPAVAQ